MGERTDEESATDHKMPEAAGARRVEMMATIAALVPFAREDAFRIVEIGSGDGLLAETLLGRFPGATLIALDGSASMREQAKDRTARFGARVRVRAFDLAALDWWDLMHGAGLVVSSLCIHRLNDAKKQYLYKAVADRLAPHGAFLIADLVDAGLSHYPLAEAADHPSALFHHLVWLKHAGFAVVDGFWMYAGRAVYGGFK